MVQLQAPTLEVRLTLAGIVLSASVPERVALQALALCLSWPSPPWEAEARLELERANQEERECRQFLQVARPDEKQEARQGLFNARVDLDKAKSALEGLAFQLQDVKADAKLAMDRLQAAGVSPSVWSPIGQQLLTAWVTEILPAPESEVQEAWTFTLPPPVVTSDGGSKSPTITPETL